MKTIMYCCSCHRPLLISKETAVKNGGGKVRCNNCGQYVSITKEFKKP